MFKVCFFAACLVMPNASFAQLFGEGPPYDCELLESGSLAKDSCECRQINNAVARLECFDSHMNYDSFDRNRAELLISLLLNSPNGRLAIDRTCVARSAIWGEMCQ